MEVLAVENPFFIFLKQNLCQSLTHTNELISARYVSVVSSCMALLVYFQKKAFDI